MQATTSGFDLAHHNIFFAEDYAEEFDAIFRRRAIAAAPTVYVCAQDRGEAGGAVDGAPERLLALVNAPADGDVAPLDAAALTDLEDRTFGLLQDCGLLVNRRAEASVVTTPTGFHDLFPATGGALYGPAVHGATATFKRPGSRTRVPGLYLGA